MRWYEEPRTSTAAQAVAALLLVVFISLGCAESSYKAPSDPAVDPEPTAAPTPTAPPVPGSAPTATSVAELSDAERLEVAQQALDAQGARDLIAWDVLNASVDGDFVAFQLCGWTGVDAFDAVYRSNWDVSSGPEGELVAAEVSTSVDAGDCLNTELVDSAFDFLAEYESYWSEILRYPERFEADDRSERLHTAERYEDGAVFARRLVDDGIYGEFHSFDGTPLDTAVTDILWRRFRSDERALLELAFCRDADPRNGFYRDGVLVDGRGSSAAGPHVAHAYELERSEDGQRWVYAGRQGQVWADCFAVGGSWEQGAAEWRPSSTPFEILKP